VSSCANTPTRRRPGRRSASRASWLGSTPNAPTVSRSRR
jgi:hypothetical protein